MLNKTCIHYAELFIVYCLLSFLLSIEFQELQSPQVKGDEDDLRKILLMEDRHHRRSERRSPLLLQLKHLGY